MKTTLKPVILNDSIINELKSEFLTYRMPRQVDLGTFEVESGRLIATDPCYDHQAKSRCRDNAINNAKNGVWKAKVYQSDTSMSRGPSTLVVEHEKTGVTGDWEKTDIAVGVDSGQVCVFDRKFFNQDSESQGRLVLGDAEGWSADDHNFFYRACCRLTLGGASIYRRKGCKKNEFEYEVDAKFVQAGVLAHGAVSNTLHGDGEYPCFVKRDRLKRVVAVKIVTGGQQGF